MSNKVYVTGVGIISALGISASENLKHLKQKVKGIEKINFLSTVHKDDFLVGEVKYSNNELLELCQITKNTHNYSRTTLLGLLAAKEAISDIDLQNSRTGFISANSVGGMGLTELFYPDFLDNMEAGAVSVVSHHDCGDSTEIIAQHLGITNYVSTISTACSSSANSIMLGARLIKQGMLDRVIVGGTDALTKFTLNGFNTLQILDKEHCRPFDETRKGLNLGEGAGYLVLESAKLSSTHKSKILAELAGYGNANDAYHQTASSPDGTGAGLAIKKAFNVSKIRPNQISYINTHGTGTENNDLTEGLALERIFGKALPPYSSTKAFTGHTLGAAGGIEAVISILAINNNTVFANLNFNTSMKEFKHTPVSDTQEMEINHVLSNSFGFGGNCSSLIFSKFIA